MTNERHNVSRGEQHTRDEVWTVVNRQGEHISTLRADVAGLKSTMAHGFSSLESTTQELLRLQHAPTDKPDIKGWVGALIAFAALIGALFMSIVGPIQKDVVVIDAHIDRHTEELSYMQRHIGTLEARVEADGKETAQIEREQQEINNEVDNIEIGLGEVRRHIQQVERRLEDVDKLGSRRWIEKELDSPNGP